VHKIKNMINNSKYIFIILIIIATIFEIAGDILFKKWAIENRNIFLITGLIIYFASIFFLAFSLKFGMLSEAISILTILNFVVIALVGVLIFKEDLSIINKAGIALGILSVILIEL
jgi:multidrug transporter EmrE-like cation transporter